MPRVAILVLWVFYCELIVSIHALTLLLLVVNVSPATGVVVVLVHVVVCFALAASDGHVLPSQVDVASIEEQIAEKKRREAEEKERERLYGEHSVILVVVVVVCISARVR